MDEHTAKRLILQRRGMAKVQKACDEEGLPYPLELIQYLQDVYRWRNEQNG